MASYRRTIHFSSPVREDLIPAWIWAASLGVIGSLAWFGNMLGFWQTGDQLNAIQKSERTSRQMTFVHRKEQRRAEAYAAAQTLIERRLPILPALEFPPLGSGKVTAKEIKNDVWLIEGCIGTFDRFGRSCTPTYRAELAVVPTGEWKLNQFIAHGLPTENQPGVLASL